MATQFKTAHGAGSSQFLTDSFQRGLAHWNRQRLAPGLPDSAWPAELERDHRMLRLENAFLAELRDKVRDRAAEAPTEAEAFVDGLKV